MVSLMTCRAGICGLTSAHILCDESTNFCDVTSHLQHQSHLTISIVWRVKSENTWPRPNKSQIRQNKSLNALRAPHQTRLALQCTDSHTALCLYWCIFYTWKPFVFGYWLLFFLIGHVRCKSFFVNKWNSSKTFDAWSVFVTNTVVRAVLKCFLHTHTHIFLIKSLEMATSIYIVGVSSLNLWTYVQSFLWVTLSS